MIASAQGISPALLEAARNRWEPHEGKKYVRFAHLSDSDDSADVLNAGVAVFEQETLAAIGYTSLGTHKGKGLKYEQSDFRKYGSPNKPPRMLFSNQQHPQSQRRWEWADSNEWTLHIHTVWNLFFKESSIRFHSRLALLEAHIFGFIEELPDGYIERDLSTRYQVPERLTSRTLQNLLARNHIQKGDRLHIESEDAFQRRSPDRTATVRCAYRLNRSGEPEPIESAKTLRGHNDIGLMIDFPDNNGNACIPARFLRFHDNSVSYLEQFDDEWTPEQYDAYYNA